MTSFSLASSSLVKSVASLASLIRFACSSAVSAIFLIESWIASSLDLLSSSMVDLSYLDFCFFFSSLDNLLAKSSSYSLIVCSRLSNWAYTYDFSFSIFTVFSLNYLRSCCEMACFFSICSLICYFSSSFILASASRAVIWVFLYFFFSLVFYTVVSSSAARSLRSSISFCFCPNWSFWDEIWPWSSSFSVSKACVLVSNSWAFCFESYFFYLSF